MGAATAILWVDGHPHLLRSDTDGRAETAKSPFDYHIQVNTIPAQHYEGAMTGTQWMIPQHNSNLHGLRHNASGPVRVIGEATIPRKAARGEEDRHRGRPHCAGTYCTSRDCARTASTNADGLALAALSSLPVVRSTN